MDLFDERINRDIGTRAISSHELAETMGEC